MRTIDTVYLLETATRKVNAEGRFIGPIAERIGVSASTLSRVEHGHLPSNAEDWTKICAWLGVAEDHFDIEPAENLPEDDIVQFVDNDKLSQMVIEKRGDRSLGDVALEARVLRRHLVDASYGRPISRETFRKICAWLGVEQDSLLRKPRDMSGRRVSAQEKQLAKWRQLNERQQEYMRILYSHETNREKIYLSRNNSQSELRKGGEWRWMPHNTIAGIGDSLDNAGIRDQGTGSTYKALETRGYIETRITKQHTPGWGWWDLLEVRLTTAGRSLAKQVKASETPVDDVLDELRRKAYGKIRSAGHDITFDWEPDPDNEAVLTHRCKYCKKMVRIDANAPKRDQIAGPAIIEGCLSGEEIRAMDYELRQPIREQKQREHEAKIAEARAYIAQRDAKSQQ